MKIALGLMLTFGILAFPIGVFAEDGNADSGYYIFATAELRAGNKSNYGTVVSADRKGIYVETPKGEKRVKYSSDCSFAPRIGVATHVIEIANREFIFDYMEESRREAEAISVVFRSELETETEIAKLGGGSRMGVDGNLNDETRDLISDLQESQEALTARVNMDIEERNYGRDGVTDFIQASFTMQPQVDVEDAFCAIIVHYQREVMDKSGSRRDAVMIRLKKIGKLLRDVPNQVKFGYTLPEGYVTEEGIELYFYSGNGEPLASSVSKGLRSLSKGDLERFRAKVSGDS